MGHKTQRLNFHSTFIKFKVQQKDHFNLYTENRGSIIDDRTENSSRFIQFKYSLTYDHYYYG